MPKMLFTQTVRYPLYESIYAQAGETKDVPNNLVERMIKRGAQVLKEESSAEGNQDSLETNDSDKLPEGEDLSESLEGNQDSLENNDLDSTQDDLDADADLLGGDAPIDAEDKSDEDKTASKNKNKNKNKNK